MTVPTPPADWHHAPDHLVALVAALAAPPVNPDHRPPTPRQWYAQIRRVVDKVWAAGWLAGTADVVAQLPPTPDDDDDA